MPEWCLGGGMLLTRAQLWSVEEPGTRRVGDPRYLRSPARIGDGGGLGAEGTENINLLSTDL